MKLLIQMTFAIHLKQLKMVTSMLKLSPRMILMNMMQLNERLCFVKL